MSTREAVDAVLHKLRTAAPKHVDAPWHTELLQRVRCMTAKEMLSQWWCCALIVFVVVFIALLALRPPFANDPATRKPHWGRMFACAVAFGAAAGLACHFGCD